MMKKYLIFSLALIGLLISHNASAALNVVQATSSLNTNLVSSSVITPAVPTTAGDLLVILEGVNNSTTSLPTDSRGQTWILATSSTNGVMNAGMYYIANSLSIATASCNIVLANTNIICNFYEISGAATTNVLDSSVSASNAGSVTSIVTPNYSTTNANDILLFGGRLGGAQTGYTPGTGFAFPAGSTSTRAALEYDIVSSTLTNTTSSMSWGTGATFNGVLGAFKSASTFTTADVTISSGVTIKSGVTIR